MTDMRAKATVVKHNATRQFRHNDDNSPNPFQPEGGFVFAYDILIIDKFLAELLKMVDELEAINDTYRIVDKKRFKRLTELEAKLDAVRPLSEKWRRMKQFAPSPLMGVDVLDGCADELNAALGEDND